MTFPLVTVIIPTYNYGKYITETINSVIKQNYPIDKIEIIVVDDGSTDNTMEVLRTFLVNGIINYYFQENQGKASATSAAIKVSTGKYIFNLDADDWFLPGKIIESVRIFESSLDIVHVATPAKIYFSESNKWDLENFPKDILQKLIDGRVLLKRFYNDNIRFGGGSTYAARSSVLKVITIPNEVDMYIDEFLLLTILSHGYSFFIEEPLSVWRVHSSNYSGVIAAEEQQLRRGQRLLSSSAGVLKYLIDNRFESYIIKIYKLQDATRRIAYKESCNNKSMFDIIAYLSEILRLKPTWNVLRNYSVFNRFIPTFIIRFLKNFLRTNCQESIRK